MFDPRAPIPKGQDTQIRRVWCAENVNIARTALQNGERLIASPFVRNDPRLRKPGIPYDWSKEELEEIAKCKTDIVYFAEKYVQLFRPDNTYGLVKLRPYQKEYLRLAMNNRFILFLAARQVGKTTTTVILLLWLMTFFTDMKIAIIGDKLATAAKNVQDIQNAYFRLPFFLQCGCVGLNKCSFAFDNGSSCFAAPCNLGSIVGKTISVLYFDEMAIPADNRIRPVWEFASPTISALQNSKIICTSSPRGQGVFKEIHDNAGDKVPGKNGFIRFRVDWWEVPGRDEFWRQQEIARLGSERAFNQQYGNEFLSDSVGWIDDATAALFEQSIHDANWQLFKTMVSDDDADKVRKLIAVEPTIWKSRYRTDATLMPTKRLIDCLRFDTNQINIEELKRTPIIITLDVGEGRRSDFTIAHFWRPEFGDEQRQMLEEQETVEFEPIELGTTDLDDDDIAAAMAVDDIELDEFDEEFLMNNAVRCRQIGVLSTNEHCIAMVALFLQILVRYFFNPDLVRICSELDGCGGKMQALLATEIVKNSAIELDMFALDDKNHPGIYQRGRQKLINVQQTESYMADNRIIVADPDTYFEIGKFEEVKPNKWAGNGAHDDLVMACVILGAYMCTKNFSTFVEDVADEFRRHYSDDEEPDYIDEYTGLQIV